MPAQAYEQLTAVKGQWTITMEATKGDDKTVFAPQASAMTSEPAASGAGQRRAACAASRTGPSTVFLKKPQ
jgi:hypothetical protein